MPSVSSQVAELGKLMCVVAIARAHSDIHEARVLPPGRLIIKPLHLYGRLAALSFVMIAAILFLRTAVTDWSPLLIVGVCIWILVCDETKGPTIAVVSVVAALALAWATFHANPSLAEGFPLKISERLVVWVDLHHNLLAANQLLQGQECMQAGGWFGNEGRWTGANQESVMALAKTDTDMISSWIVHRYGATAALGIIAVQCLMIVAAWSVATSLITARHPDYISREASFFLSSVTKGMTAVCAMQGLFSWGNGLGWTPLMGQPSTLFSFGRGHSWAVALPMVFLIVAARAIAMSADEEGRGSEKIKREVL
jgi:cell division protein FtsW (lipid II flippase)